MTYEQIVERVRDVFEYADARNVFEHIAIQVNVVGEGSGIFYVEIAERQICVEPYDYYDRDVLITTDAATLMDLCDLKYTTKRAIRDGKITYAGNERKLDMCLTNVILSKK